jgi:hypothetical protein
MSHPWMNERNELIPGSPDWEDNFGAPTREYGTLSCDWGDCDELSVTLRNHEEGYGWLPVCEQHRESPGLTWLLVRAAS